MKIPRAPHSWALTPARAIEVQRSLSARVRCTPPVRPIRVLAGVDCAFSSDGMRCLAAAVSWDLETREVLEERHAARPLRFPYVPGLLSFREAPAMLAALRQLRKTPDALLVDGHGIAHPRRFGIASHLGVLCEIPTVGCAKSRLVGEHATPGIRRGARTQLMHRGESIGSVLRTRAGTRPIYVSVGHRIDLATATRIVLAAAVRFRLPEPTRLADRAVARVRISDR